MDAAALKPDADALARAEHCHRIVGFVDGDQHVSAEGKFQGDHLVCFAEGGDGNALATIQVFQEQGARQGIDEIGFQTIAEAAPAIAQISQATLDQGRLYRLRQSQLQLEFFL